MKKVIVVKHVHSGEEVYNGYSYDTCVAPKEDGLYTLYEVANDSNIHIGWEWVRECEGGQK